MCLELNDILVASKYGGLVVEEPVVARDLWYGLYQFLCDVWVTLWFQDQNVVLCYRFSRSI